MSDRTVRIIGVLGLLWNLAGVANYLAYVGLFGGAAAPSMPPLITAAFATAVFAGAAGSLGLTLRARWAAAALWLSFVASVVNWGWVLTNSAEASLPLGMAVIGVALTLAIVSGQRSHLAGA